MVSAPQLKFKMRTLPNGLQVCTVANHKIPTVAVQVWYRVGGKNDPEGKSGFAHLFEHLMFKATRNMKSEMMDRLTEDVGGENNAFTTEDCTVYTESAPSNYLETLLWAESDRMANLVIDDRNFFSERAVVEEEYRQSILSDPYGRLDEYVHEHSFAVHPYHKGVIGSIANLDAAKLEDVRQFHSMYYRPDNAVLIVSGDFDQATVDGWIDKYLGRVPKPAGSITRVTVKEPMRSGAKTYDEAGPNVPLPAVVINYLVPSAGDSDAAALNVAGVILSRGHSSRLYQALVHDRHVAAEASAGPDLRSDAGLFAFKTTAAGGTTLADAEKATFAEIERFKSGAVTDQEIMKARNLLVADAFGERETASGVALSMGDAITRLGDAKRVNTEINELQAVTPADILRVARKYFVPQNQLIMHYTSAGTEQGGTSVADGPLPAASPAQTPNETPPTPSAPRKVVFPNPIKKILPNGLEVLVISRPGTGLVTVNTETRSGAFEDPATEAGLANFTASLLTKGTTTRSAAQIAEETEHLGGSLDSNAGWDSSAVTLNVLAARLPEAMSLYADVVMHPTFTSEEVDRLRSEVLDDLTVNLRRPGTLARYAAARVVFGNMPYGHQPAGTPESLAAIKPADITEFYSRAFEPGKTAIVFGGDIKPAVAFELAEKYFGNWKKSTGTPAKINVTKLAGPSQTGPHVLVIDKPDAGQAAVTIVREGIRRSDPSYVAARVANGVLGEGFSSRLNQEIRIKRGLSYGAGSGFENWTQSGLFMASAQTRNDKVAEVADLIVTEIQRLTETDVPAAELIPRKASLSGDFNRKLETGSGLTTNIAYLWIHDQPLNALNTYLPRVETITADEIKTFAAKHMTSTSIVVVGDSKKFLPELRKKYPNLQVIEESNLDLNRGDLKKK